MKWFVLASHFIMPREPLASGECPRVMRESSGTALLSMYGYYYVKERTKRARKGLPNGLCGPHTTVCLSLSLSLSLSASSTISPGGSLWMRFSIFFSFQCNESHVMRSKCILQDASLMMREEERSNISNVPVATLTPLFCILL